MHAQTIYLIIKLYAHIVEMRLRLSKKNNPLLNKMNQVKISMDKVSSCYVRYLDVRPVASCDYSNLKRHYLRFFSGKYCVWKLEKDYDLSLNLYFTYFKNMKERVRKLTYSTLQHCMRMLYTMNGNSKH